MRKMPLLLLSILAVWPVAAHREAPRESNAPRTPILLELFTSEGCSSCPPADLYLQHLDELQPVSEANLIVLSEHVDYWNRLGWRDPYSSSQFSERQTAYATKLRSEVFTPQLVVDGRYGAVGSDSREALSAIQRAAAQPKVPIVISDARLEGQKISAHVEWPASGETSAVLVIAVASNRAESHVARGENSGRVLQHVAVTRVLESIGKVNLHSADGREVNLTVPQIDPEGFRLVAFLEDAKTGYILGVTEKKL